MHINDIMSPEVLNAVRTPSKPHYAVFDENIKKEGMMDDDGGRYFYGEQEWELIVTGNHPHIQCERIEITLH